MDIEEVKTILKSKSISISRIPPNIYYKFVQLANDKFCGDYGMTLKWLIDIATDIYPKINALINKIIGEDHDKSME